jgi:lipoprotein-releasing system permease protein
MDYIPVYLELPTVLILNAGVLALCLLMLLIPSWIITRISPARAIRFA